MMQLSTYQPTTLQLNSLDDLIHALQSEKQVNYNHIIRSFQLPGNAFDKYSSWCDASYTRNCIAENEKFELILLCWKEGQITPIHDHGGEECWVKIIEGKFKETIYTADKSGNLSIVKSIFSKTNDTTYMIDFMGFHSIENLSKKKSMSLHLYAKPIKSCNIFDENSRKFVPKNLAYDTSSQLEVI